MPLGARIPAACVEGGRSGIAPGGGSGDRCARRGGRADAALGVGGVVPVALSTELRTHSTQTRSHICQSPTNLLIDTDTAEVRPEVGPSSNQTRPQLDSSSSQGRRNIGPKSRPLSGPGSRKRDARSSQSRPRTDPKHNRLHIVGSQKLPGAGGNLRAKKVPRQHAVDRTRATTRCKGHPKKRPRQLTQRRNVQGQEEWLQWE